MMKKKCDLPITLITHPPYYPSLDLISQLISPLPYQTVCLNIAPSSTQRYSLTQIDVFELCFHNTRSLRSVIPDGTELVIVNNLSIWILYCGVEHVYRELLSLSTDYRIAGVMVDGTMEPDHDTLSLLGDVILSLSPAINDRFSGSYTETVRQSTGKTVVTTKSYQLKSCDSGYKLDLQKLPSPSSVAVSEEKKSCDVTFELGLSDREKSARAATVLPYTAAASSGDGTVPNAGDGTVPGQGDIHYVPEEEDDWDDEDPDDDLDI